MSVANDIPIHIVREMVENNYIAKAIPSADNFELKFLMIVWQQYAEPDLSLSCGLCLTRVLDNFRQLQNILASRVYEDNLLNNVD